MAAWKNIRAKVATRDGAASGELNRGPPLGIEQNLVVQPVRDELLADVLTRPTELSQLLGELGLAAGDIDRSLEGANVVLLHDRRKYTRNLVDVNKNLCLTSDKESCTVLSMTQPTRKPAGKLTKLSRKRRPTEPEIGPDGFTLPQRVTKLMVEHSVGQTELARMCSRYYATFVPSAEDKVKQQHIFNLLQGQSSAWCVPLIAAVFDVSDIWLQYGIGKRERSLKN